MEGRRRGLEFFGTDIFYAAGNARKDAALQEMGKKYICSILQRLSARYGSIVIKTIKENKSYSSGEKSVYEHQSFRGKGGINV
ncbi:MAG: hypothetical protein ACRERE_19860 [Candidatus Entotheonellia bacterium]